MQSLKWLLLPIAILTGGCSNISPGECLYGDWYARGQAAREAGLGVNELMRQQNACVRHGVVPDRRSFIAGYNS